MIRKKLADEKSKLDDVKDYQALADKSDIFKPMKRKIHEMYNAQFTSNAWLKMYEILSQCDIVSETRPLHIFFNAELPGAFICATNHFLKTRGIPFEWIAASYLPEDKTAKFLDDTYGIYKKNRKNWIMNKDNRGNLLNIDSVVKLIHSVMDRFPSGIDLYTSDAGIGCEGQYNEQEELTQLLNLSQIIVGICTLAIGGSMVTKQYTFFSAFNRSVIMYFSKFFNNFYIVKPCTSRPVNSEVYLVGEHFKGIAPDEQTALIELLASFLAGSAQPIVYCDGKIDEKLLLISHELFEVQQINAIEEMLSRKPREKDREIKLWLEHNKIQPLKTSDHIPSK
jgi:23S rRNA U2552 (ribose-2'-O)-methylase RlmE/FtsJ